MTPEPQPSKQQYKRIALHSKIQDEDGYISRVPLCLCEHCKVNGFLCPKHPVINPSPTSADQVLEDLRQWMLEMEYTENHPIQQKILRMKAELCQRGRELG